MKLHAISDIHISHPANLDALRALDYYPDDWLLLGGDVCESTDDLTECFSILGERFAQIFWVPGNHELWTTSGDPGAARGVAKYEELLAVCREFGVRTPEDEYLRWPGPGPACTIAPLFVLYDYSFRGGVVPEKLSTPEAIAYSRGRRVVCVDEELLHPDPFLNRSAWCHERVSYTRERLRQHRESDGGKLILLNHFPLQEQDAVLPRVPSFVIWCGTRLTESWADEFPVHTVVYGHLHIGNDRKNKNGTRFVDVSFGYPRQRPPGRRDSMDSYLKEILPGTGKDVP